ncbi:MAG: hypothetical protein P1V97_25595 [Planctomycetota bacterium]|nr:hypothetical protein [Planctomycetota bacterium]
MIIVKHKNTQLSFVLLGTGYGHAQTSMPSAVFGHVYPDETEETHVMLCICDGHGEIAWCPSEELEVVSVDGVDIQALPNINTFSQQKKSDRPSSKPKGSIKQKDDIAEEEEPTEMRCARCDRVLSGPICKHCDKD